MDTLIAFLNQLASLVPVIAFGAPLIAVLVDGFKKLGLQDGMAPVVSSVLNVILYAVVFFAGDTHLGDVQNIVGGITLIAPVLFGLIASLLATPFFHDALSARGIGFKHSLKRAG